MITILSHVGDLPMVRAELNDVHVIPIPNDRPLDDLAHGQVLVTTMVGAKNLPDVLGRGVRWVHTVGTGVDRFPFDLIGDRQLSCSRGTTSDFIAEWVVAQLLAAAKRLPESWVTEPPARWGGEHQLGTLRNTSVAILGFGAIGVAVATRLAPFGCKMRALRRSATPSPVPDVQLVSSIDELVSDADHLVLAAPLTAATRGIVDRRVIGALKPGAHLVNVSRAELVEEADLRQALDDHQLGLASIDVSWIEPLPAGHWLYDHPRVHFSPHLSWSGPGVQDTMQQSFITNFHAWRDGRPLPDAVDLDRGY